MSYILYNSRVWSTFQWSNSNNCISDQNGLVLKSNILDMALLTQIHVCGGQFFLLLNLFTIVFTISRNMSLRLGTMNVIFSVSHLYSKTPTRLIVIFTAVPIKNTHLTDCHLYCWTYQKHPPDWLSSLLLDPSKTPTRLIVIFTAGPIKNTNPSDCHLYCWTYQKHLPDWLSSLLLDPSKTPTRLIVIFTAGPIKNISWSWRFSKKNTYFIEIIWFWP